MKISLDRDLCTGTGTCVRQAPRMLRLVREGSETYAEVVPDGEASNQELRAAAESCPWAAVRLEDDAGAQIYP